MKGPFSIERGGELPVTQLVPFVWEKFQTGWSLDRLEALLIRESGLYAYLGTKDLREAERRAHEGVRPKADLVLQAPGPIK